CWSTHAGASSPRATASGCSRSSRCATRGGRAAAIATRPTGWWRLRGPAATRNMTAWGGTAWWCRRRSARAAPRRRRSGRAAALAEGVGAPQLEDAGGLLLGESLEAAQHVLAVGLGGQVAPGQGGNQ